MKTSYCINGCCDRDATQVFRFTWCAQKDRQTEDTGQASQQRLRATQRSQPLICMPKMFSAESSGWELHTGGQTEQMHTEQNHCLTHLYPQVRHHGKHERLFQHWQYSSGTHDFGKKRRHCQAVSPKKVNKQCCEFNTWEKAEGKPWKTFNLPR